MSAAPPRPALHLVRGGGGKLGLPIAVGLVVLVGWEAVVRLARIPPVLLPGPTDIAAAFPRIVGDLSYHALATGTEAAIAFLISAVLGALIAGALSASTIAFEAVYPHLILFQIIPKIALAPLFTFWLGLQSPSRLAFATFISFFPVVLATMTGLTRTDPNALRLCRALTASRAQTFFSARVPFALPYFFSGLKVAATLSIVGVVVGEFISAQRGLGYFILFSQARGQTAEIFAALICLCVVGLVPYLGTIALERRVQRWWRG